MQEWSRGRAGNGARVATGGPRRARRAAALLACASLAAAASPRPASACSVCRCGDPAFNALGLNIYAPGSWRLALDWDRYSKEQGVSGGAGAAESMLENRLTVGASYTVNDRLTLLARLPFTRKETTTDPGPGGGQSGAGSGRGLSDPELYALVRLWAAPFAGGLGRNAWVALQAGVKTAWGRDDLARNGARLDQHLQAGTGSTDWTVGLSGVRVLDPASTLFASLQYRYTGTNAYGYRYGSAALATAGYDRKLNDTFDGVVELDYRHAREDRTDRLGTVDPDTGGALLYLTPKLVVNLARGLVARISAQVPIAARLDGVQTERTVWSVGLTYVLGS